MDEIQDLAVGPRMPIFEFIWNVLEFLDAGQEFFTQVSINKGVRLPDTNSDGCLSSKALMGSRKGDVC